MVTRKLPYYEFADGIYEIDEFDCVSVFVIVGSTRALVIDCGTGIGDLRWVIENKITDKPYDVVATHNHGDHIGGAGFFDSIYIHPADMDWDSGNTLPTVDFRKSYAKIIADRADKHYDYNLDEDVRPWPKTPEKLPLTDGQVFELGDRTVTAYHCPGHTFGEMVFRMTRRRHCCLEMPATATIIWRFRSRDGKKNGSGKRRQDLNVCVP